MTSRPTPAPLTAKLAERASSPVKAGPTMADVLYAQRDGLSRALPRMVSPERFLRVVATELRKSSNLQQSTPVSFLGAVFQAAQLGLEFGPLGHAYLIPFRNHGVMECQFIIGYKGYVDLARRSGKVVSIVAREVCENDKFDYEYGIPDRLSHKPALNDRGAVIAYYGIAVLQDGGNVLTVMGKSDIEKRRQRSKAKDAGPWVTDYDAMARKTVIRSMVPWLPMSAEVAAGIAADDAVIRLEADDLVPEFVEGDLVDEAETVEDSDEPALPLDEPD